MQKIRKLGVENMAVVVGDWDLSDVKGIALPQKVESAFTEVVSGIVGADYEPVAYLGKQLVNGVNYKILALKTPVVPNGTKHFVKLIINVGTDKKTHLVSISRAAV